MALKVFSGLTFAGGQQLRTIVATTSQARAAQLVGVPISVIRDYWSVTGNAHQVDTAMSQPGVVFKSSGVDKSDYTPVKAKD